MATDVSNNSPWARKCGKDMNQEKKRRSHLSDVTDRSCRDKTEMAPLVMICDYQFAMDRLIGWLAHICSREVMIIQYQFS